ncbi:hypothetical protein BLA29_002932 [Euroglyphus maynei]|uniref:Uncharacterized protein n=1 Tax=Euroglyphus maynei TaxID=6958 RepID=A0A1Y3B3V4_EURMA|nr:hypothetical protein BLA29_002932 [Euroglyphus maynei]
MNKDLVRWNLLIENKTTNLTRGSFAKLKFSVSIYLDGKIDLLTERTFLIAIFGYSPFDIYFEFVFLE